MVLKLDLPVWTSERAAGPFRRLEAEKYRGSCFQRRLVVQPPLVLCRFAWKGEKAGMAKTDKADAEKPLEKMTAKELRELAKTIPGIAGVHGMNKDELVAEIKKARGIEEKPGKRASGDLRGLKKQIKTLKVRRRAALEASDKKTATICRRKISRLKKKTRRAL
jgi:hypothetical protein